MEKSIQLPPAPARHSTTAQGLGAPWTGDVAQGEHLHSTFEALDPISSAIKQTNKIMKRIIKLYTAVPAWTLRIQEVTAGIL